MSLDITDEEYELLIKESMERQARPSTHQHIGNFARIVCKRIGPGLFEAQTDEALAMFLMTEKEDIHCHEGTRIHNSCMDAGRYRQGSIFHLNVMYGLKITEDSWGRDSSPA